MDTTNGPYLAWLSTSTTSPDQRFVKSTGPYVLPNGTQIAADYADLTDGLLDAFPRSGSSSSVWTGTLSDGTAHTAHCDNWTNSVSGGGNFGSNAQTGPEWTTRGSPVTCSANNLRLYCFQQIPPTPPPGPAPPEQIPTLGSGGFVLLISLLLVSGIVVMRRRQAAK